MVTLTKHQIVIVADCVLTPQALEKLRALTVGDVAHAFGEGMLHPLQIGKGERPAFRESEFELGPDLHPSVGRALARGDSKQGVNASNQIAATTDALNALNGLLARPTGDPRADNSYTNKKGLEIKVGVDAKERLEVATGESASEYLTVRINSLKIIRFNSGIGIMTVGLQLDEDRAISEDMLFESISVLAPRGRKQGLSWASQARSGDRLTFSFENLIAATLSPAGVTLEHRSRYFTYVYGAIEGSQDESAAADLAWFLSRHYSRAYRVRAEDVAEGVYRAFTTVAHAVNLEGASMVVREDAKFLVSGGMRERFDRDYLPLILLAYHEYVGMLHLSHMAAASQAVQRTSDDPAPLQLLMDDFLRFRLGYRLPVASEITMHNRVYTMARQAFTLDDLHVKASQDVAELEQHVRTMLELRTATAAEQAVADAHDRERRFHARERRRAPILGALAGMLAFLSAFAAFREVEKVFTPLFEKRLPDPITNIVPPLHVPWTEIVLLSMAMIISGIAIYMTWARQRDEHREDVLAAHHGGRTHSQGHVGQHVRDELTHEGTFTAIESLQTAASVHSRIG